MSVNGETADLVIHESFQITEESIKLAALGAKNLAALLLALAKDNQRIAGLTTLKRMLQDNEPLTVFAVKEEDLDSFRREAKNYGVLFCHVKNKAENTGTVELIARVKDAQQINHIFEKMGYPAPAKEANAEKKDYTRTPSERSFSASKESGTRSTDGKDTKTATTSTKKPSVKEKIAELKKVAAAMNRAAREAGSRSKEAPNRNSPEL